MVEVHVNLCDNKTAHVEVSATSVSFLLAEAGVIFLSLRPFSCAPSAECSPRPTQRVAFLPRAPVVSTPTLFTQVGLSLLLLQLNFSKLFIGSISARSLASHRRPSAPVGLDRFPSEAYIA
jgi:hypothetical protein